jgi:branched-chain amino acid transport system permease protein
MFSVYWPLRKNTWPATVVISTLGASIVIRETVKLIWGPVPLPTPPLIKGTIRIGLAIIEYQYLIIIAVGLLVITSIFILFEKSYVGRLMQAAAQDRYAASILGISTVFTTAATYAISIALAGMGGYLAAPLFLTSLSLGSMLQKAFAAIIIGGYGNVKGALVGSILVGLIESFSVLVTSMYKDALIFLILLIVLVIKPTGLFGQLIDEKA